MWDGSDQSGAGGQWARQGAVGETQLQLLAEGSIGASMSLLPGEWVWSRSPGAAVMGNEASAKPEGGRLCREHTWLGPSLGYPEQRAEASGCHMPSLVDRHGRTPKGVWRLFTFHDPTVKLCRQLPARGQ